MSNMWVTIGVDAMQAKKLWKALETSYMVLGQAEAKAVSMASMEIASRVVPMIAPTVAPAN